MFDKRGDRSISMATYLRLLVACELICGWSYLQSNNNYKTVPLPNENETTNHELVIKKAIIVHHHYLFHHYHHHREQNAQWADYWLYWQLISFYDFLRSFILLPMFSYLYKIRKIFVSWKPLTGQPVPFYPNMPHDRVLFPSHRLDCFYTPWFACLVY